MRKIIFLFLFITSTTYGQAAWQLDGQYFKIMDQDTGEELSRIDNFKPVRGFFIEENTISLFSSNCEDSKCLVELTQYLWKKGSFEYKGTVQLETEFEFGICVLNTKNMVDYGMAVNESGIPIYTFAGNQPANEDGMNCMHLMYFSGKGDFLETRLYGNFDSTKDGLDENNYRLLKKFFVDNEGLAINSIDFVTAKFEPIEKSTKIRTGGYAIHYSGDLDQTFTNVTKITRIKRIKLSEEERKNADSSITTLGFDCTTCPEFKED